MRRTKIVERTEMKHENGRNGNNTEYEKQMDEESVLKVEKLCAIIYYF